jgi:hypothetical protein
MFASPPSGLGESAKCIGRAIRGSIAMLPSKSCRMRSSSYARRTTCKLRAIPQSRFTAAELEEFESPDLQPVQLTNVKRERVSQ